jgi:hypothetical protein
MCWVWHVLGVAGTNYASFLCEANRIVKLKGKVLVAEVGYCLAPRLLPPHLRLLFPVWWQVATGVRTRVMFALTCFMFAWTCFCFSSFFFFFEASC